MRKQEAISVVIYLGAIVLANFVILWFGFERIFGVKGLFKLPKSPSLN